MISNMDKLKKIRDNALRGIKTSNRFDIDPAASRLSVNDFFSMVDLASGIPLSEIEKKEIQDPERFNVYRASEEARYFEIINIISLYMASISIGIEKLKQNDTDDKKTSSVVPWDCIRSDITEVRVSSDKEIFGFDNDGHFYKMDCLNINADNIKLPAKFNRPGVKDD